MHAYYADHFVLPLPEGHRFPMRKYSRLRDRLAAEVPGVRFFEAPAASDGELALVHAPAYIQGIAQGTLEASVYREIGFPWSPAMAERARRSVGASVAAARAALTEGVAGNLAGGTHHAYADKGFADHGEGFCVLNDVAITIRRLQHEGLLRRALVIDLDVHQGNGTAAIFEGDESVFTFSMHGERNYPARKMRSSLDVGLPDGIDDERYLEELERHLPLLTQSFRPEVIFYLAGVDVAAGDRYGRFALSDAGIRARDRRVIEFADQLGLPLVITLAGGYAADALRTALLHSIVFEEAIR